MTDIWGAISIPLPFAQAGQPAGDPCLYFIGSFLQAFLATDQNAVRQWSTVGVSPTTRPIETFIVARPDDRTYPFASQQLPALFLFRDGGTFGVWADDYDIVTDKLKLLWVLPEARPENTRAQLPYMNAFVKAVHVAIELGRTPSWKQTNDPDPFSVTQGSLLYTYADFAQCISHSWRFTFVHVADSRNKRVFDFPAVEITYDMVENRVIGTDDPLRYKALAGATDTISIATFVTFQTWAASTTYTTGTLVVPPTSNGNFYRCSSPGTTGATPPVFPTVAGFYVNDGTAVWQCLGTTSYARWQASTAYALNAFVIPPAANGFYYQATAPGITGASAPAFPTAIGATVTDGAVVWTCVAQTSRVVDSGPLETITPGPV